MDTRVRNLIVLNVAGGTTVLASYAVGVQAVSGEALWGGVPDSLRSFYTVNMFLAAFGYFFFTHYILFRLNPETTRIAGRFGYRTFYLLFGLILIPSALWLPLTALMVEYPSLGMWAGVRIDLALVGFGALGLLTCVFRLKADAPTARRLAIAGLVPFCIQTAVLDALVWPAFFPFTIH
jgi:hypothetical protein